MSNIVPLNPASGDDGAAAAWIARIDAGPLSREARAELRAWLDADPHRPALLDEHARAWALAATLRPEAEAQQKPPARRSLLIGVAASVAALVGAGTLFLDRGGYRERFSTGIGESRTVALPDGSRLVLNTGSELSVRYDGEARRLTLARGEALFEVARDADRPFEVVAQGVTTRAIGTRFAVRLLDDERVAVVVTEGRVTVSGAAASAVAPVAAGERATAVEGRSVSVSPAPTNVVERATAWSTGGIAFRNEPLGDVVAEVGRYAKRPVRIDDPGLASLRISGFFATDNPDGFIAALAAGANLQLSSAADGGTLLRRKQEGPAR